MPAFGRARCATCRSSTRLDAADAGVVGAASIKATSCARLAGDAAPDQGRRDQRVEIVVRDDAVAGDLKAAAVERAQDEPARGELDAEHGRHTRGRAGRVSAAIAGSTHRWSSCSAHAPARSAAKCPPNRSRGIAPRSTRTHRISSAGREIRQARSRRPARRDQHRGQRLEHHLSERPGRRAALEVGGRGPFAPGLPHRDARLVARERDHRPGGSGLPFMPATLVASSRRRAS
jgi:hypothetical protein